MATIFMTMIENAQDCTLSVRHTNFNISRDWTGFSYTFTVDLSTNYSKMLLRYIYIYI